MSPPAPQFHHMPNRGQAGAAAWLNPLLLLLLGASWGLQFTLLKVAVSSHLSELAILTGSMILLAGAYLATLCVRQDWFRTSWRHIRFFAISGMLGYVVPLGGVLWVADQLSAGLIVLYTEALIPVFTIVIALMLRTERLSARRLLAVAVALAGVAIAMSPDLADTASARLQGLLIVLVIPLSYSVDGIYVSTRWPQDLRPFQVVTGEAVAGAVLLLPILLLVEGVPELPARIGTAEWAVLAFVPVSYLEVYLYFYLLRTRGAVFVSFGSFVSLFAGFFWGAVLLGETHGAPVWVAVAFVSLALYLVTVRRRDTAAEPAEAEG